MRFQSEDGKFIDADAIATAYAQTIVLQDKCEIQHLMNDIADNREHRDPAKAPAVPIDELVRITRERLTEEDDATAGTGTADDDAADTTTSVTQAMTPRRTWLFALYDQLDDIDEATKHNLAPLAEALEEALTGTHDDGEHHGGNTDSGNNAVSDDVPAPAHPRRIAPDNHPRVFAPVSAPSSSMRYSPSPTGMRRFARRCSTALPRSTT